MINNEAIQSELEKEQEAATEVNTLSAALLLALSKGVNSMYRSYAVDGIVTLRQMNQRGRKKGFFKSLLEVITAHYKRVRDLVSMKATDGYKKAFTRFMGTYEKELDLPLVKDFPEKTVNEAMKQGYPLNKTMKYNRDKTMQQMRKEFETSWKREEPQDKVLKRVETVVQYDNKRVLNVAQEETARMQSAAQAESVKSADDQGVEVSVFWHSLRDEKVRMAHRKLHEDRADKNGWFYCEGLKAKHPHGFEGPGAIRLNINCRCYLAIVGANLQDTQLARRLQDAKDSAERRRVWEARIKESKAKKKAKG
jgi:hypothetical protein